MGFLDSYKDVIKVANRVDSLGDQIDRLARISQLDSERKDVKIRELEDRLLQIETAFDFGIKTGMIKIPPSG